MNRLLVSLVLASAACAHRPLSITEGDRWSLPLVDPLGSHELTVPVLIDGKGPYPFVLAPNASRSIIDDGVAEALGLHTDNRWWPVLTQSDHDTLVRVFEVTSLESGTLRARQLRMFGARAGSLSVNGRPVAGLLGNDVLTTSLVTDVDRDHGVVRLAVAGHEAPPPPARAVDAEHVYDRLLVPATVDDRDVRLALDPHTATCEEANGVQIVHVDETGNPRRQLVQPTTSMLRVDGLTPLASARRHRERVRIAPRAADLAATAAARIARWGAPFAACAATGCATVAREGDALLVTPALPGRYQVTIEALDGAGRQLQLVRMEVAGPTRMSLEGVLTEATALRVVDAAPEMFAAMR